MSLFVTSLNSGSNGNCYYIGNEREAVLVDAGISCRETEKRMSNLGLSMNLVKAIFISHEHTDHTRGAEVLSKKYKLPVYVSKATLKNSATILSHSLIRNFSSKEKITLGDLAIIPFSKKHDAADPFSFIIEGNGVRISVITDIGIACEEVIHYFKQSHAAFLEANYDEQMLEQGSYPYHLKKRIRGGMGHLSNDQALQLFVTHRPGFMSHLILSHLSKENNCPDLVQRLFNTHAGNTKVVVASRYKESEVFHITNSEQNLSPLKLINLIRQKTFTENVQQMSLFDNREN